MSDATIYHLGPCRACGKMTTEAPLTDAGFVHTSCAMLVFELIDKGMTAEVAEDLIRERLGD